MEIRVASYKDISILVDMVLSFYSSVDIHCAGLVCDPGSIHDTVLHYIENGIIFVCDDGEVFGAIAGSIFPWECNKLNLILHEAWWYISELKRTEYPTAAFRLMKKFIKYGKTKGAQTLVISSTERQESLRVQRFYKKIGLSAKDHNYIGRI